MVSNNSDLSLKYTTVEKFGGFSKKILLTQTS